MKNISLFLFLFVLFSCQYTEKHGDPSWEKMASGVWLIKTGTPEKINLTSELGNVPRIDAINAIEEVNFPLDKDEIVFEQVDGKIYVRFPLREDEKIYGLGLNFKTVEQRGRILRLHVDHYGGTDNGRTHAPVPFFVSSEGYGAFINSARYIDVYCGTGVRKDSKNPPVVRDRNTDRNWSARPYSDNLEFLIPAEGVEIVLFAGQTMLDVVRRFNLYNGGGVLPPKWGLGFWHRVPMLYSDRQVEEEIAEFEKHKFPLTVLGLEPGWMSRSYPCTYEWDKGRFPEPENFVNQLREKNIRLNVWMNPGVSPESEIYDEIEPYTASHTLWTGIIPDYSLLKVREIMGRHLDRHLMDMGVSGLKMDENDGYDMWLWPDVASFPSDILAEQMRQIYGMLMQQFTFQKYRERNRRTYGLVRAGNAGSSSYPYVFYSDYYNHRDFITALINSSFIGILWTPEVRSSDTAEEWLRRMQSVCFSPIAMLDAWSDGTKPWTYPEVEKQVNEVTLLRMQMIPYLYSAFADYYFEGTPPMRAMNLESGYAVETVEEKGVLDATNNPYAVALCREVKDQFMVGENLLVAPFFAGERERKVVLPKGKWYDFFTGEFAGESEVITVSPGLDRIPVFVKDGGIVPLIPPVTTLDGTMLPLEIRHYGSRPGKFQLYDDDGETFDYEKGEYTRIGISVEVLPDGTKNGVISIPEGKKVWSYNGEYNFHFMTNAKNK